MVVTFFKSAVMTPSSTVLMVAFFYVSAEFSQRLVLVQFPPLFQGTCPGHDDGHRVGGGHSALQIAVVVAAHGAVGYLILIIAVRGYQDTSTEVIMAAEP